MDAAAGKSIGEMLWTFMQPCQAFSVQRKKLFTLIIVALVEA